MTRDPSNRCEYQGTPRSEGFITKDCRICVRFYYFDQKAYQLAYKQFFQSKIQEISPRTPTPQEIKQFDTYAKTEANKVSTQGSLQWQPYRAIYKCSDCVDGKEYRSTEAEIELQKNCKTCEDQLIPGSNPAKYRAVYTGGVDPKSCDSCKQNSDGAIIANGACIEKNQTNKDPDTYFYPEILENGDCECVRKCITPLPIVGSLCKSCEECERTSSKKGHSDCVDICKTTHGPGFICQNDDLAESGSRCICKFVAFDDWNTISPENQKIYSKCPADKPNVVYPPEPRSGCMCGCPESCTSKTNYICKVSWDETPTPLGCGCKYVDEDDYIAGSPPKYPSIGPFQGSVKCAKPDTVRPLNDGGCDCGYTLDIESLSLDLIP